MKLNKNSKKQIIKWIQALRSGEFKQTKTTLQDSKGYCCLGVACQILIPKNKLEFDGEGFIDGGIPDDQFASPKWLQNISNHIDDKLGWALTDLNDIKNYTFNEIADLLELVYIHKAI